MDPELTLRAKQLLAVYRHFHPDIPDYVLAREATIHDIITNQFGPPHASLQQIYAQFMGYHFRCSCVEPDRAK